MMDLLRSLFFLLVATIAFSCQKGSSTTESKAFGTERAAFFNNLIAPSDIATHRHSVSGEFNEELPNSPQRYLQYAGDEITAAANMGVYIADLNYSIAYGQREMAKEYFKAGYELSKIIEIEKGTLAFLIKRYEDNLERNDSVRIIINDLWSNSLHDMEGTKHENLAGVAMAAYQIENLHIALGMLKRYFKQDSTEAKSIHAVPLLQLVIGQRANIEIIYRFLKSLGDPLNPDRNPNFLYYSNAFEELIVHFKKLEGKTHLSEMNTVDIMDIMQLSERIDVIRNKIVVNE
jgi:hypothetical protein